MKSICNKINKYGPVGLFMLCSIILYIVLLLGSEDNDMYFEIMSGRDLLRGNFNTASHLDNFPIIVQQWLYSVVLAVFDNFGRVGHILVVLIQNVILWIVSGIFIHRKTKNKKLAICAPFILTLLCYYYLINIRPQIITMIFLVTELIFIDKYHESYKSRYLLYNIPLLILSANFHQSLFLYHLYILIPYYFVQLKRPSNFKEFLSLFDWKLILATPVYLACSLCTPYGIKGSLYIVNTFRSKVYDNVPIKELSSGQITNFTGIQMLIVVMITIILIYKHKSNLYVNFYSLSLFLLFLTSTRHISILYFVLLVMICSLPLHIESAELKKWIYNFSSITLAIFIITSIPRINKMNSKFNDLDTAIPEKDARIFNEMDCGGYLEYCGYTKMKFDSRCEVFTKEISGIDSAIDDYLKFKTGYDLKINLCSDDEVAKVVENYDYAICISTDYFNRIAEKYDFKLIYQDKKYLVWKNMQMTI